MTDAERFNHLPEQEGQRRRAVSRVTSIDIFRGLTMLVMIFVNDLASIHGLPWWTNHAREDQDVMTYVDMVFPFFLFIVGMSMPLAIRRRLDQNPSHPALWLHIVVRSIGLVILGLILANAGLGDPRLMGIPNAAWALLAIAGGILLWLAPSKAIQRKSLYRALHILGFIFLVIAFAIFRRKLENGKVGWIDSSYPEILGIIGYTYLSVAILYILTRRWLWAPLVWFVALSFYCAFTTASLMRAPALPAYLWPVGHGDSASITMAGVATSTLFFCEHRWTKLREKMIIAGGFAIVCLTAAWFLKPLGVSKIRATPTWCLVSIGASVLSFMLLYWLCDVRRKTGWAAFVKPAGSNTLLTYLLPDIYFYLAALAGFTYFDHHFNSGSLGVLLAVVFTFMVLGVAALLTKWNIRLQL
jgi:heparan-alpha-glucosaminide N-acetyltransferase